jgi:hypothetical protein
MALGGLSESQTRVTPGNPEGVTRNAFSTNTVCDSFESFQEHKQDSTIDCFCRYYSVGDDMLIMIETVSCVLVLFLVLLCHLYTCLLLLSDSALVAESSFEQEGGLFERYYPKKSTLST